MAIPAHPHQDIRLTTGRWCDYGTGADIDAAWDDAVDQSLQDFGRSGLIPSIIDADPGTVTPSVSSPLPAPVAARQALTSATAGQVHAIPVGRDSRYTRTRLTLRTNRTDVVLHPGPILLTEPLESVIRDLVHDAGHPLTPDTLVETVTVTRSRYTLRGTPSPADPGRSATHVLITAEGIIVASGPTAGAVRRAGMAAIKDGQVPAGTPLYQYTLVGRSAGHVPPGHPRLTGDTLPGATGMLTSTVTRAATTVKVVLSSVKNPAADTPIIGWMFAGTADR